MKIRIIVWHDQVEYESKESEVTEEELKSLKDFFEKLYAVNIFSMETTTGTIYFPAEVIQQSIVSLVIL